MRMPGEPSAALAIADRAVWVMAKGYAPDEGGMQAYAAGVAEAYARLGAKVTVFTQTSRGPRREQAGPVSLVDVGPGGGVAVLRRLLAELRRARATAGRPLFVHGTTWRTSVVPLLLGLNYCTTFHGREFMAGGALPAAVMRLVARRALRLITVSEYSAARLRSRLGQGAKPVVAFNGVSFERAGSAPPAASAAPPVLFSLCRLESRKNIAACVKACARLRERGRSFRYVVAGRGPELESLRELVSDLGLEREVELAGYVSDADAIQLYRAADIFLHPQIEVAGGSDFEGFGIAIADAMISRCAVVVGRDGGAAELVECGVSGLVADGRNDDALVDAVDHLLADEALRTRMAIAAEERARACFSWDRHAATILHSLGEFAERLAAQS